MSDIKSINIETLRVAKDTQVDAKLKTYQFNTNFGGTSINQESSISDKFADVNTLLQVALAK